MADKVITSTGDCSACCEPPADCPCALLIPPFEPWPYADYATAAAAIADQVSGCLGYFGLGGDGGAGNSISAAFDGTTLSLDQDSAISGGAPAITNAAYASVSMLSGGTLSGAFTSSTDGTPVNVSIDLLSCSDGSLVDSDSSSSGSGTVTVTAPADGEYVVLVTISSGSTTSYLNTTWDITCSSAFTVNPVIALWDDSGTTRRLWACPKLLLPPLTEDSGTWYADCAAADAVLTSDQVSNCAGYIESLTGITTFTATDNTTDIELVADLTTEGGTSPIMWAGFNGEAGETLLVTFGGTFSGLPPVVSYEAFLYDDTGVLIDSSGVVSSAPFEWQPTLPYTGRYTISFFGGGGNCLAVAADITATGTFSVNPIQARYDLGLDCSGNLDCGDSCP